MKEIEKMKNKKEVSPSSNWGGHSRKTSEKKSYLLPVIIVLTLLFLLSIFFLSPKNLSNGKITGLAIYQPSSQGNVSENDVLVWQGQYFIGTEFQTGTYEFEFNVYDAREGGNICYTNITTLTTGNFGEWKTEQSGVGTACNDASRDYFLEIKINGETQGDKRRLQMFDFLRKDVDETTSGSFSAGELTDLNKVYARLRIITAETLAKEVLDREAETASNTLIANAQTASAQLLANVDEMKSTLNNNNNHLLVNVTELSLIKLDIAFATAGEKIIIDSILAKSKIAEDATLAEEKLASEAKVTEAKLEEARVLAVYKIAETPEILEEAENARQRLNQSRIIAQEKVDAAALIAVQVVEDAKAATTQELTEEYEQIKANLTNNGGKQKLCLSDGTNCPISGGGNPFDQSLNTTDSPTFQNVTADSFSTGDGNLKWKIFTGTLDADSTTTFEHGIPLVKLAGANCVLHGGGQLFSLYDAGADLTVAEKQYAYLTYINGNSFVIDKVGTNLQGNEYRCIIWYIS